MIWQRYCKKANSKREKRKDMSKLPATIQDMLANLGTAIASINTPGEGEGGDFLKLTGALGWTYGQDAIEVQEGSKWAINPSSMSMGFIAWASGDASEVLGDVMRPIRDGIPLRTELPELDDSSATWDEQVAFQLVCLTGEDATTQVLYKASTLGGIKAFKQLLIEIQTRASNRESDLVPIIKLEKGSYPHKVKKYGTVTFPVFNIIEWKGLEDGPDTVEDEPEAEEKPKAKRKRTAVKEEAEVEEEAPKRRRRRKVA
jgi:hypothetical protein